MKLNIVLLLFSALALTACNDDDNPTTTTSGGTTPVQTQNAFETVNNALTSLTAKFPTTTCNATTGAPTSTPGSSSFVTDQIFCSLNAASNSTGSIRNGYARTAALLCALNKTSPITNSTTPTIHDNIAVSETDPCFTGGGVDLNNDGDTADTIPVSFRETTGGQGDYETKIEMQPNAATFNTTGTSDTTLYLKNGPELSAAKSISATVVTESVVKRSTGETFYESRDYKNFRHTRMYAKGTLETNGSISTLNNLQLIQASGNTGSEGGSVLYATDATNTWQDQYVGTTRSQGFDTCTTSTSGGTANCTNLIIAYDAKFHDFTANPVTNYNNGTMMTTTAPINMSF